MAIVTVPVTTTGASGSAAGTANSGGIKGLLLGIRIVYTSQHANTDVVIAEVGGMGRTLLTVSNNNANVEKYPVTQQCDNAGAVVTGAYVPYNLSGVPLSVTVAQGNSGAPGVTVIFDYTPD